MRVLPIIIFAFSIVSLAGVTYYFELKKAKNEHSTIAGRNFEIPREASKVAPQEAEIGTVKLYTSIGVTTVVLVACLFVMLASRYSPDEKHWAYATLGTLIGYWLKT